MRILNSLISYVLSRGTIRKDNCELINVMLIVQVHPTTDQLFNDCHGTERNKIKPLAAEEIKEPGLVDHTVVSSEYLAKVMFKIHQMILPKVKAVM